MAKFRMSPIQEMNLMNAATGDIPLSATSYSGSYLDMYTHDIMGTLFRNQDIRKAVAAAKGPGVKGFRGESLDVSGGEGVIDELRQRKLDRHQLIINSFYNSMHEGMWEGAKALALEFHDEIPGLLEIYRTEYEKANVESIKFIINTFYNNIREGLWDGAKIIAERFKYEVPGLREAYKLEQEKAEKKAPPAVDTINREKSEKKAPPAVKQVEIFEKNYTSPEQVAIANGEAVAINKFYEAANSGDLDTAYKMIRHYNTLQKLLPYVGNHAFKVGVAKKLLSDRGLSWLVKAIEEEGMSELGVQCVAFIADIINYYAGKNIVTKGSTGGGKVMLSKMVASSKYDKNIFTDVTASAREHNFRNLKFGDLLELPGHFGHVMMFVGYNKSGAPIFIEATGELQDSPIDRWKGYSAGDYKYYDETDNNGKYYTAKGLKPHLQTYDKNYLIVRGGGVPTRVLRMSDTNKLPKDTKEAVELLQLVVPSGNESGGL